MFSGSIPKQPKESIVDTFTGAPTVIARAIVNTKELQNNSEHNCVRFSPNKNLTYK